MDNTKRYIRMCKAALGDLKQFALRSADDCLSIDQDCGLDEDTNTMIPLFRQDELQNIVKGQYKNLAELAYVFYDFITQTKQEQRGMDSYEQLWLAFVMMEKRNGEWDGSSWI